MGLDRFVYWKKNKPTKAQLRTVLEDYLGGIGRVDLRKNWLLATLPGKASFPFRRIKGFEKHDPFVDHYKGRWFEVYVDSKSIDVITRQQDEFTSNVAKGFAELAARFWGGKHEEPL